MPNREFSTLDRRQVLRVGLLAGLSAVAGCGEPGGKRITAPPSVGGTRARLARFRSLAAQAAARSRSEK